MVGKTSKTLIPLFLFIFLISLVNGIDTYSQNSNIDISHPVRLDGEIISGVECNITIYYPDNSVLIDFQPMTDNGDYFNYSLNSTQTETKGIYKYVVSCEDTTNNLYQTDSFEFLINLGGVEPSESRTQTQTRNIYIFFGLGLLFFISMFFVEKFPIKLTLFLLMAWFFLMGINFSFVSIGDEVLNPTVENFYSFFLTLSFYANYFIFITIAILWLITFIVNAVQINKQKKAGRYGFEGLQQF